MNIRILIAGAVAVFLILGGVGYFISANLNKQSKVNLNSNNVSDRKLTSETYYDFGDAPDGEFPSLLASNGARSKKTDDVWLGQAVTFEKDSKQVNLDETDDGVKLNVTSCKQSTVYFFVRIKNPGKMIGTAYLNLYADWNKDGKWQGGDECGAEWAVQNFAIDLSKQTDEIAIYSVQFTAGKNIEEVWYRASVTLNEQMNETSTGEFLSGEVEDWNPVETPKDYWLYCDPYPLSLNHGDEKTVTIKAAPFSQKIKSVALSTLLKPDNDIRKITRNGNSFTYKSKKVDGPKRDEPDFISYLAVFTDTEQWWDWCPVTVHHGEPTIETPSRRTFPVPSEARKIETESGGRTKTESPTSTQPENYPIQEGDGGFITN